ncbi:MAG: hydroxymethylbilane synthase [Cyanobacteriota bacterium]
MNKKSIIIGSRESQLALVQTEYIICQLRKLLPQYSFEVKTIKTKGDKILSQGLSAIGDKGLFTKELEIAIQNDEIDFAVHSFKDLPTILPHDLTIAAISKREIASDVLIAKCKFNDLPSGSIIGTSSLRRRSQLIKLRSDLNYKDIRGNLNTRLSKLDNGQYDAIILAYAGIKRLGFENRIVETFDIDSIIPAAGQGALAVECKKSNEGIISLLKNIDDKETRATTLAERTFLSELQGGCQVPIGAIGYLKDNLINLTGFVSDLDANKFLKDKVISNSPVDAGIKLANKLKAAGADQILLELTKK